GGRLGFGAGERSSLQLDGDDWRVAGAGVAFDGQKNRGDVAADTDFFRVRLRAFRRQQVHLAVRNNAWRGDLLEAGSFLESPSRHAGQQPSRRALYRNG